MKKLAELMNLQGRVALITGGTGYIGVAMASALAELGCNLCLLDLQDDALVQAANRLRAEWGARVETLRIDLENEQERNTLPHALSALFGRLDILINNAGFVGDSQLQGWVAPLEEQRVDTWRRALEVNLTAVFHLSQILASMLREYGKGTIVNISSIYGVAGPDLRLYEGTKMGTQRKPPVRRKCQNRPNPHRKSHGHRHPLRLHARGMHRARPIN